LHDIADAFLYAFGGDVVFFVIRFLNFSAAFDFMNRIAEVAEADDHHPDLHLTGYRKLRIELATHAIGGLSENDFILAAKIDQLPKVLKK